MKLIKHGCLLAFCINLAFAKAPALNNEHFVPIKDLLPTTYYITDEEKTSCKGMYRRINYDGSEVSEVLTPEGQLIAKVCTRFYKTLKMEGTGVLKDRGQGRLTVNWAGNSRFRVMTKCKMGMGVGSYCLLPFHTIAADLVEHKTGTVIFIERAKGIVLPDGSTHNGIFEVRDTGGAFRGIGPQRVDLFIANQDDSENVFRDAGFHHRKPEKAYRLKGKALEDAKRYLRNKFPDLY